MKTIITSILIITTYSCYGQNELPAAFADLLEKTGLTFTPQEGWVETPVIKNPILDYDYALKYENTLEDFTCELRFAIRPEKEPGTMDTERFTWNFNSTMSTVFTSSFMLPNDFFVMSDDYADMIASYEHYSDDGRYKFKPEFAQSNTEGLVISMYRAGMGQIIIFLLGETPDCPSYYSHAAFQTLMFKKK